MHVLFLALTIYLIGTTLVLYLRPATMFHPGGAWKEFSLTPDANHTYMPFWLFSILWAFFSYLLATFIPKHALNFSNIQAINSLYKEKVLRNKVRISQI